MPDPIAKSEIKSTWFQKTGYILLAGIFIFSVLRVFIRTKPKVLYPGYKVITIGHWLLEEGFREGMDEIAGEFEKMKALQGIKVKIKQSTIPVRGYKQWMTTQLIGGNPADIIAIHSTINSPMQNRYFHPLSSYISKPNPFNKDTPLEKYTWRDSVMGSMERSLDPIFADYYGVATYWNLFRLYINLDLLEKATGDRVPPKNLTEWLEDCRMIKEYSKKTKEDIIPIGIQGKNRKGLRFFMRQYFSQLTGNYNFTALRGKAYSSTLLEMMLKSPSDRKRITAVFDLLKDLGQYFGEGFSALDREQILFLFYSKKCVYYYSGSWEVGAILKESPFDVGITPLPPVGQGNKFSQYYTGPIAESGITAPRGFGITKASDNFDLALEFLQFITSYKMNPVGLKYCKWLPIIKHYEYKGELEYFKPLLEGNMIVSMPFDTQMGRSRKRTSERKWLEDIESMIIKNTPDAGEVFWENLKKRKKLMTGEMKESITSYYRSLLDMERDRSKLSVGLMKEDMGEDEVRALKLRKNISNESAVASTSEGKVGQYLEMKRFLKALSRL